MVHRKNFPTKNLINSYEVENSIIENSQILFSGKNSFRKLNGNYKIQNNHTEQNEVIFRKSKAGDSDESYEIEYTQTVCSEHNYYKKSQSKDLNNSCEIENSQTENNKVCDEITLICKSDINLKKKCSIPVANTSLVIETASSDEKTVLENFKNISIHKSSIRTKIEPEDNPISASQLIETASSNSNSKASLYSKISVHEFTSDDDRTVSDLIEEIEELKSCIGSKTLVKQKTVQLSQNISNPSSDSTDSETNNLNKVRTVIDVDTSPSVQISQNIQTISNISSVILSIPYAPQITPEETKRKKNPKK